jgi:hypothetical protein
MRRERFLLTLALLVYHYRIFFEELTRLEMGFWSASWAKLPVAEEI